ncbi:MAG: helix-turn-helix domain-containing protein [Candidatus Sedimenticola sp. 6PFRAG5]
MKSEKFAYSISAAVDATSYSRSYLYQLIKKGRLQTYRRGGRVFITAENLKKLIEEDANNGAISS